MSNDPVDRRNYSDAEGYLTHGGRIRVYGYSNPPETDQTLAACAGDGPLEVELQPRRYSWCSCGHSKNQPFCDNAHRDVGTNRKSYKFEVLEACTVKLCMCKQTSNPPFCDGTHNRAPAADSTASGDY